MGVAGACVGGGISVAVGLGRTVTVGEPSVAINSVGIATVGADWVSEGVEVTEGDPLSGELKIHAGINKTIIMQSNMMGLRMLPSGGYWQKTMVRIMDTRFMPFIWNAIDKALARLR